MGGACFLGVYRSTGTRKHTNIFEYQQMTKSFALREKTGNLRRFSIFHKTHPHAITLNFI